MTAATLRWLLAVFLLVVTPCLRAQGERSITAPREQLGFNVGDDYTLANYRQLTEYWKKLAVESDRMKLVEIGKTAEGRPQWMAILTSPENHKRLERHKEIARRLALADGVTEEEARRLAAEGRAVVWIDGGLHATEVLGAHQLLELVYQFCARNDPETLRILRDVILLAVHANPDGHDLVADSYMKEQEPARRAIRIPRLYQKYIGHDNNRDLYMSNMPESANMNRVLYREWFPQIMYNHHQSGPAGTVLFAPPFREPYSFYFDPLIRVGLNLSREKFFIPGSVLSMRVDNTHPLAWGMGERADFFYDASPAFRLGPEAAQKGVQAVAWFDSRAPLRSGWAWGQHYLEGAAGVVEAVVGPGKLFLYGPEVTFRAQPHGTFKLLFNGIYYGPARRVKM